MCVCVCVCVCGRQRINTVIKIELYTFMRPYQLLALRVRVDQGEMATEEYSAFPKFPNITGTSPSYCLVSLPM